MTDVGMRRTAGASWRNGVCAFAFACLCALSASAAEIHAVWDHTGRGLYPGNWPQTIAVLKASHVTDIFVNVAGADFAHYPSAVLPKSGTLEKYGDQMAACLRAAKGSGIRVHAWIICFNATRNIPKVLESFRQRGWRLKDAKGKLLTYLDPSVPSVRARALAAVDELVGRYQVDGIHLDFVRWGDAAVKPANAAAVITQFVAEARRHVKRPRWLTTAVYGRYPNCVEKVGQDWKRWLDFDLVDYVVPMDYAGTNALFEELLRLQMAPSRNLRRTIVGIGVTSNEATLNAKAVVSQINLTRKYGFPGQSLFDLDWMLAEKILPVLRQGTW